MYRKIIEQLSHWIQDSDRKPLVLRGARQVGKTWVVRYLASKLGLELVELNFERDPQLRSLFKENDPDKILIRLSVYFNIDIHSKSSLLFLDEIQAAPELLSKLRWFAEEKPELAVIATGSLLDFALDEHEFSMPVGRINYMYLEPMSFEEFLMALNEKHLVDFLCTYEMKDKIPEAIHNRLWEFLREYVLIGGMPAAINSWAQHKSIIKVNEIHQNILSTYRDDFSKYAKRISTERLDEIFRAVPHFLGKKFKYSLVNREIRAMTLQNALNLLCKARVCHKVLDTTASSIPLGATIKENIFKVIFLDVGLVSATMGLSLSEVNSIKELKLMHEGGLTEQLVGQLLRMITPYYIDPQLYYWVREKTGSESEVDYLVQQNTRIIPIEVKSGTTGTLRSLHTFMKIKELNKAIRLNADYPSITDVQVKDHSGELIEYQLISLPLYLTEQLFRFI